MILDELVGMFLVSRRRGLVKDGAKTQCRPKTMKIYEANLNVFVDYLANRKKGAVTQWENMKEMHFLEFLDFLDEKQNKGDWSLASKLQVLRSVRTFFRYVAKNRECREDKLPDRTEWLPQIAKNKRRKDGVVALSAIKQFRKSFNTDDKWEYRDYVACCLMMTNGIRLGELCSLRLTDVMWDEKLIRVSGKTTGPDSVRSVPITESMARLLKRWLQRRETCVQAKDSPYVFITKRSPQLNVEAFGMSLRKHRKKHNLPRITAHSFRHTFATTYLRNGGSIDRLKMITGHTTFEQLRGYLDEAQMGSKDAQDELERVSLINEA